MGSLKNNRRSSDAQTHAQGCCLVLERGNKIKGQYKSLEPKFRQTMKTLYILPLLLSACADHDGQKQNTFPAIPVSEESDWTTYEGKWLTAGGSIHFELSLKSGAFGQDSYFQLIESFESDSTASGTKSQGLYSTYNEFPNKALGICLHDVNTYEKGTYLRFKKSNGIDTRDEMFFMTRGNDELLPCDNTFTPL